MSSHFVDLVVYPESVLLTTNPETAFKATTGMGRRPPRRPRRVQTPRPRRRSPDLVIDSTTSDEDLLEDEVDPNLYRYSRPAVPIRRSYTPAPTHPRMPSVTTGTTPGGSSRAQLTSSNNAHPESRRQSSRESSGLTYVSDDPVIPPPPPGFVPYPSQEPLYRQRSFPTPHVPFQQSPLHPAPVPPPQMHHYRDRASNNSQSD